VHALPAPHGFSLSVDSDDRAAGFSLPDEDCMSARERRKGQVAEREACKLLSDELGIEVTRHVDQARQGGADVLTIPGYAVEIKRRESLSRPAWWAQAVRQGIRHEAEPLVLYRQSRKPWRALIAAEGGYRDVTWAEAMDVVRDKLQRLFGIYREAA
jgi:hypothetical protein